MTEPQAPEVECPVDPASDVVTAYVKALRDMYDPKGPCPPVNGSANVRTLSGAGPAAAAFEDHRRQVRDCKEPFLWVRVGRRYRAQPGGSLAQPIIDQATECMANPRVVQIEVGVGRCAVADFTKATWDDYSREFEEGLDDSWRIENVLCRAATRLRKTGHKIGSNTIDPYGPEGAVVMWVGTAYVQLL